MRIVAAIFVLFALGAAAAEPGVKVAYLGCENLLNPLGIDEKEPRLSWLIESPERGQKQTGYRVIVASNAEALKGDKGDLGDRGKVAGDQPTQMSYRGK